MALLRKNRLGVRAMLARLLLLSALLTLAACAAAVPGYTPPPLTEKKENKFIKPLASGSVGPDGHYHMSDAETAMDCKRLTGSMQISISRLKDSYGRDEPSALSSMAQSTFAPVLGGANVGWDRQAVFARERAKLDAYNNELASRNCKTIDIDAELSRPAEPPKNY
jgi:hypothetical protein